MFTNLKNWQKVVLVLVVFNILFYALGKLFVPVKVLDHAENYMWPPLIYSVFFVLPILVAKYAEKRFAWAIAKLIAGAFFLLTFLPLISNFSVFYANAYGSSGNPISAIFSMLYVAPLNGGLIFLSLLSWLFN